MNIDPNAPADTRIMGIVHDALRRDLSRLQTVLRATAPPPDPQRVAIAEHVLWMMRFLHMHHGAEDNGLWPLIRRLEPDAGALLDQMDADHARVSPKITQVAAAATNYRADRSPEAQHALAAAVAALDAELRPHLRREEDEMMPIVARTLNRAQWDEWNQSVNIAPKSSHELGIEGHWLIDSADRDRYDLVVHEVPAVLRFVILRGYARPYRRACALRWGSHVDVAPLAKRRPATAAGVAAG